MDLEFGLLAQALEHKVVVIAAGHLGEARRDAVGAAEVKGRALHRHDLASGDGFAVLRGVVVPAGAEKDRGLNELQRLPHSGNQMGILLLCMAALHGGTAAQQSWASSVRGSPATSQIVLMPAIQVHAIISWRLQLLVCTRPCLQGSSRIWLQVPWGNDKSPQ